MFRRSTFNQFIGNWDVSKVTDMAGMFEQAQHFNQPLDEWDVSEVTNMNQMFEHAEAFDQPINSWNVARVKSMFGMFRDATAFNQPLDEWDTSSVENMNEMFAGASRFNQPIGAWNVSAVVAMRRMFFGAFAFDQPIGKWDVSSVTTMEDMFRGALRFNQPLDKWEVSNVTNMGWMFEGAYSFDQNLGDWNIQRVESFRGFLGLINNKVALSTAMYESLLIGWSNQQPQSGMILDGGLSQFSGGGATARQYLIDTYGWFIRDGGLDPTAVTTEVPIATFSFNLGHPYPNPAATATTIAYTLPEGASQAMLTVFDVLGRPVYTVTERQVMPGRHEGVLPTATLPSGTYFVRLTAGKQTQTRTLVVAR